MVYTRARKKLKYLNFYGQADARLPMSILVKNVFPFAFDTYRQSVNIMLVSILVYKHAISTREFWELFLWKYIDSLAGTLRYNNTGHCFRMHYIMWPELILKQTSLMNVIRSKVEYKTDSQYSYTEIIHSNLRWKMSFMSLCSMEFAYDHSRTVFFNSLIVAEFKNKERYLSLKFPNSDITHHFYYDTYLKITSHTPFEDGTKYINFLNIYYDHIDLVDSNGKHLSID